MDAYGIQQVQAGPSVSTGFTPTRAPTAVNEGQGLDSLANAMGNFFGTAQKSVQTLDQVEHQINLAKVERENKDLRVQAVADQSAGREADPISSHREAYHDAYAQSAANAKAGQLASEWNALVRKAPKDGTWDYSQQLQEFSKNAIGSGTGDPTFDAHLGVAFKQQAEAQMERFNEAVYLQDKRNTLAQFDSEVAGRLSVPGGLTADWVNETIERGAVLHDGDKVGATMQVFKAIGSNVENEAQAFAVLQAAGSLADEYPDMYRQLTQDMAQKVNQVRSFEASTALTAAHDTVHGIITAPIGRLDRVAVESTMNDLNKMQRTHGMVQQTQQLRDSLMARLKQEASHKAHSNTFEAALNGKLTREQALRLSGETDGDWNKYSWNAGMDARIYGLPAVVETAQENGVPDFLKTPAAAQQVALFASNPNVMRLSNGKQLLSDNLTDEVTRAATGMDRNRLANALRMYRNVVKNTGDAQIGARLFGSTDAARRIQTIDALVKTDDDVAGAIELAIKDPAAADKVVATIKGEGNWANIGGLPRKQDEASIELRKKINESLRKAKDPGGFFNGYGSTGVISDEGLYREIETGVMKAYATASSMGQNTGDLQPLIDREVKLVQQSIVALPNGAGAVQMFRSRVQADKGHAVNSPIASSLDPTARVGRSVYALSSSVTGADGKTYNTIKQMEKDNEKLASLFPDYKIDKKSLGFVQGSADVEARGLYFVNHGADPVAFELGKTINLVRPRPTTTTDADDKKHPIKLLGGKIQSVADLVDAITPEKSDLKETLRLSEDPATAVQQINAVLEGTGFQAVAPEAGYGSVGAPYVRLAYGGYLEQDDKWVRDKLPSVRKKAEEVAAQTVREGAQTKKTAKALFQQSLIER